MGIWRETWESTIHRLRRPLQKRIVVHRFCKFGVSAVLILRKTITSSYKKVVKIGSTSGMRVQSFGPSSVKMWREFPNHSAVNLQTTRAVSRFWSRVVRQPIPDSQHSRQFPLFRAKNRRTFALFTTRSAPTAAPYARSL